MKHFITSGCSFTAGVIPLPHDRADLWLTQGSVWPHFIFAKMNPQRDRFVNLALPGGGNVAAATNLIYYLETNKSSINADSALIGFNITAHHRLDVMANAYDKNINRDLCCIDPVGIVHPSESLGFGWITQGTNHQQMTAGIASYVAVTQALCYLRHHKFKYFFMIMNNFVYTHAPEWFKSVIDGHNDHWIRFDNQISMHSYVSANGLCVSARDLHPSTAGHKKIAEFVDKFLVDKSWYE